MYEQGIFQLDCNAEDWSCRTHTVWSLNVKNLYFCFVYHPAKFTWQSSGGALCKQHDTQSSKSSRTCWESNQDSQDTLWSSRPADKPCWIFKQCPSLCQP